jgi:F0F1-type ATP synthase assembly protein I
MTDQEKPDSDTPDDDNPAEVLPPGVPEPPDMSKVRDLRQKMEQDLADRRGSRRGRGVPTGKQGRDIGTYTIIPMMMLAGPLVGYLLGKGLENIFGGEPWPGVAGMLFGLVAAFRQIFLLLADRAKRDQGE